MTTEAAVSDKIAHEVPENDVEMDDEAPEEGKIVLLQSNDTNTAATYQFHEEDHTLGNALRYIIMKNPSVEFCGYSIPHPSEPKMNIRIQTWEDSNATAADALEAGLDGLIDLCNVVEGKFEAALST